MSGSNDYIIKLWNLCLKESFKILLKYKEWVCLVDISLDNIYIVSGSLDNKIIIWKRENE